MSRYFFRCPLCKLPHEAGTTKCPITGGDLSSLPASAPPPAIVRGRYDEDDVSSEGEVPVQTRPNAGDGEGDNDGSVIEIEVAPRTDPTGSVADSGENPRVRTDQTGPRTDVEARVPASEPRSAEAPLTLAASKSERAAGSFAGALLDGRYRVDRRIGEGGMGVVYAGEHLELGRPVAIKILAKRYLDDDVTTARFYREARVAGGLGHPNVVEVFDLGSLGDGRPYLVMELLQGETLGRRARREKGLPTALCVGVLRQVLSALQATHARGVVHRDLNPENVFLCAREGNEVPLVKILDFGISKQQQLADDDTLSSLTRAGMVLGTPGYMSPEQLGGQGAVDARTDLYAVGALAFEILAGRPPFRSERFFDLMVAMQTPPSPRAVNPAVPEALDAWVRSMLASLPDDRPASAAHALARLEEAARAR